MERAYQQINLDQAKPGLDRPIAVLRYQPEALARMLQLQFAKTQDDLDDLQVAIIQTLAGKQYALTRHERSSERGVVIVSNEHADSIPIELEEALSALNMSRRDLTWVHPNARGVITFKSPRKGTKRLRYARA